MTATATRDRVLGDAALPPKWSGRTREYDLVKEFVIALVVVSLLTLGLAGLFSSPDIKQINLSTWSRSAPSIVGTGP